MADDDNRNSKGAYLAEIEKIDTLAKWIIEKMKNGT